MRRKSKSVVAPVHLYVLGATLFGVLLFFGFLQIYKQSNAPVPSDPDQASAQAMGLPRLRTSGNKVILSNNGQEIRLRGVNVCSLEFDNSGRNYELSNGQSNLLTVLSDRNKWNANSFRMPLNQEWFINDTNGYVNRVTQIIDDANRKGLYVIADDQWEKGHHTNPYHLNILKIPTFGSGNTTEAFWRKFIGLYKNRTNLIYDIINEPHDYPADVSAAAMQRMVDIMRSLDPNAVIMVGGYNWAHSVDYYRTNPISGGNIIYSAHQYMPYDPPSKFESNFGALARIRPTYLGEFEMDQDVVNGQPYQKALIDYAEANGVVGWAPWAIGCGWEKESWNSYNPTRIVSDYMRRLNVRPGLVSGGGGSNATPYPVSSAPTFTNPPVVPIGGGTGSFSGITNGQSVSGRIYVRYVPSKSASRVEFYVNSSRINVEGTGPYYLGGNSGSTIYGYDTSSLPNGTHTITAKVLDTGGRTVEESSIQFTKGVVSTLAPRTPAPATNPPRTNPPATTVPRTNPPATQAPATNPPSISGNLVSSDSRVKFIMTKPYSNGRLYIRAEAPGISVNRMVFYVDGRQVSAEYVAPYTLGGDSGGNPYGYATNDWGIDIMVRVYTTSGSYFDARTRYERW